MMTISGTLSFLSVRAVTAAVLSTATLFLLGVAPARAAEPIARVAVKYADLDPETDAGARALYQRIVGAAHRVCPDFGNRDLHTLRAVRDCREQAIVNAVKQVGSTRLAALRAERRPVG